MQGKPTTDSQVKLNFNMSVCIFAEKKNSE